MSGAVQRVGLEVDGLDHAVASEALSSSRGFGGQNTITRQRMRAAVFALLAAGVACDFTTFTPFLSLYASTSCNTTATVISGTGAYQLLEDCSDRQARGLQHRNL